MLAAPGPGEADAALYDLGWGELLAAAPASARRWPSPRSAGPARRRRSSTTCSPSRSGSSRRCRPASCSPARTVPILPADARRRRHASSTASCRRASTPPTPRSSRSTDAAGVEFVHRRCGPRAQRRDRRASTPAPPTAGSSSNSDRTTTASVRRGGRVRNEPSATAWAAGGRGGAGGAGASADRRVALDARRRPDPRDRPEQFGRSVASFQAVRHKLAESLVAIEGADSVPAPAPTTSIRCWPPSPSRSPARRHARPPRTPSRCSPASASRPTTSSTCWLKRTLVVDTVFGSASSIPTEIGYRTPRRRRRAAARL